MTDQTGALDPNSQYPVQKILNYKFRFALSTIGAVTAVWYAAHNNKKGKFWFYIGGSMLGGAVGYLIDSTINEKV